MNSLLQPSGINPGAPATLLLATLALTVVGFLALGVGLTHLRDAYTQLTERTGVSALTGVDLLANPTSR